MRSGRICWTICFEKAENVTFAVIYAEEVDARLSVRAISIKYIDAPILLALWYMLFL